MKKIDRRSLLKAAGASTAWLAATQLDPFSPSAVAAESATDALPMQLYKSLSDEQRSKVCLPINHARRQYVSNWWYIHPGYRINKTFNDEQQELIQKIFDSLHSPEHQDAVNDQVEFDQYGQEKNSPAVGFFGTPDDEDFEFIYTGHHVTRRCNAHTDKGLGFGGRPIFYGHFRAQFNETKDHPGNPYWYQGKAFNRFVETLDSEQQAEALVGSKPRSEKPDAVIKKKKSGWPGLSCAEFSAEQKETFVQTMKDMLAMFRSDDVEATLKAIEEKGIVDRLYVSWYGGRYDIGSDEVWDTWQIEGPNMVWYFRGQPHIHSYFHLKA